MNTHKPLRVLHVFGKMDRGGAEMRTLDLMRELHRRKWDIQFDFVVLSGQMGQLDEAIQDLGGEIYYLPLRPGFSSKFKNILRDGGYDSLHSHVHLFSGYLLKLANVCGVQSRICHLHTTGGYGEGSLRKYVQNKFMTRWLQQFATSLIAVSRGAEAVFLEYAPQFKGDPRLEVIYDALDPALFSNLKDGDVIRQTLAIAQGQKFIIHVGRFDPVKNHPRLLEIFADLISAGVDAKLIMVGKLEPSRIENLQMQAQTLQISDRLNFLGARNDVPQLLAAADLMIFPSHWEGLPGAVLEAGAAGLTVLSSDLPGSRELADHFSTISILPLSAANESWTLRSIELLSGAKIVKESALKVLKSGPFSVEYATDKLTSLWNRHT